MSSIADKIQSVTRRIQNATEAAGRPAGSVHLLAVSKTRPASDIREAVGAGQYAFGENYLQEALDKMADLTDLRQIEWHFIGPIQSNKTRAVAENFDWVHSVDRLKIARRLSEQRPGAQPPLNVCLQVNVDQEASKAGCGLSELHDLAQAVAGLPGLRLRGLMTIPDPAQSPEALQQRFRQLADALAGLRSELPDQPLDTLSMGMSSDLEQAIAAGATWVRIGTALFGARPAKP